MTAIKGQNLRIFLDDSPIARAQSCQVHIAAEVQDISSKDSVSGWQENVVTGFSWDVTCDALIFPSTANIISGGEGIYIQGEEEREYGNDHITMYVYREMVPIPAGTSISVKAVTSGQTVYIVDADEEEILSSGTTNASYQNTSSTGVNVWIGIETDSEDMHYALGSIGATTIEDNLNGQLQGTDVQVKFSITTGDMNRTESTTWLTGYARITDISINATNRQLATYSCTLTGTGELTTSE